MVGIRATAEHEVTECFIWHEHNRPGRLTLGALNFQMVYHNMQSLFLCCKDTKKIHSWGGLFDPLHNFRH